VVDTTFFVLQLIGLAVFLHWALTHDKPDDSGAESGLLAMRPAEPEAEPQRPRDRTTPGHRRR
jgi:hypothetical protein